jgi:hypothetical protein
MEILIAVVGAQEPTQALAILSDALWRTLPANDHHAFCRIEYLPLAAVETMAGKHFLWGPGGYLRKNRSATG